jgi:hypothetical protein
MAETADGKRDVTVSTDHTASWDWENEHVSQSYTDNTQSKDLSVYDIVESGTVLIAAGPASWSLAVENQGEENLGVRLVPIGLVETATIAMSKPLSRIFEIGSKLSYIIPGRTIGEIALARVLFDGPSLLKVLYRGEVMHDEQLPSGRKLTTFFSNKTKQVETQAIGSGNIAMNLASTFFDQPIGLGFFFKDRENENVSQMYFEGCRVSTWNLGIAANMNVLTESVRMEFVQCFPIVAAAAQSAIIRSSDSGRLFDIPLIGA